LIITCTNAWYYLSSSLSAADVCHPRGIYLDVGESGLSGGAIFDVNDLDFDPHDGVGDVDQSLYAPLDRGG
jgi:hypothetical protein